MKNLIFVINIFYIYFATTAYSRLIKMSEFQKILTESRHPCMDIIINTMFKSSNVNGSSHYNNNCGSFTTCVMKYDGVLQDGKILIDKYEERVDFFQQKQKERLMNVTELCIKEAEKGETECEVGRRFGSCHGREMAKNSHPYLFYDSNENQYENL